MDRKNQKMPVADQNMRRARSLVPKRYRHLDPIDKFPHEEGMYLFGPSGHGKTHHAVRFFFKWIQDSGDSKKCHFYEVPDLLELLREEYDKEPSSPYGQGFGTGSPKPKSLMYLCRTARLLVLDDLGSDKLSEWAIGRIGLIVSHRYNELLPTIVTSNLSREEISQNISQRIGSRLSSLMEIQIEGDDRRLNK